MGIRIVFDHIPQVIAAVEAGKDELSKGVAEGIEGYANDFVPVLTGSLKASIHVSGGGGTYEVTAQSTEGGATREYAGYVEFGTHKAPAQPFMTPAFISGVATSLPKEAEEFRAKIEAAAGG